MERSDEAVMLKAIVRFIVRTVLAFILAWGLLMVAAAVASAFGVSGWSFMHSNYVLPIFLVAIGVSYRVVGFLPALRNKHGGADAD